MGCFGSLTGGTSGEYEDRQGEGPDSVGPQMDQLPPIPFPAQRNPLHLPPGGAHKTRERIQERVLGGALLG